MKAIVLGACLVCAAVGLVVLRSLPTETIADSSDEAAIVDEFPQPSVRAERLTTPTEQQAASGTGVLDQPSAENVVDGRLAKYQQGMADGIYRLAGRKIVQILTDSGLALSDSEGIARRYAADVAECAIASLTAEAARQSIPVDELLSRLAKAARDGGDPVDVIDRPSVEAHAAPCQADALQQAGISMPPQALQPSEDDTERLRACVEAYANSDITDRGTILELCAQEVFGD